MPMSNSASRERMGDLMRINAPRVPISVGAGIARAALGLARRVARELHEQGTCELIAEWALPFDEMQRLFATPHGG